MLTKLKDFFKIWFVGTTFLTAIVLAVWKWMQVFKWLLENHPVLAGGLALVTITGFVAAVIATDNGE